MGRIQQLNILSCDEKLIKRMVMQIERRKEK